MLRRVVILPCTPVSLTPYVSHTFRRLILLSSQVQYRVHKIDIGVYVQGGSGFKCVPTRQPTISEVRDLIILALTGLSEVHDTFKVITVQGVASVSAGCLLNRHQWPTVVGLVRSNPLRTNEPTDDQLCQQNSVTAKLFHVAMAHISNAPLRMFMCKKPLEVADVNA